MRLTVLLAVGMTCLASASCATGRGAGTDPAANDGSAPPTHILLSVDNHNWADVVVSLDHDGRRSRLGTAKAAGAVSLRIPASWIGSSSAVYLVAHRIGSTTDFRSEGFTVQPDQSVEWTLESSLEHSSLVLH